MSNEYNGVLRGKLTNAPFDIGKRYADELIEAREGEDSLKDNLNNNYVKKDGEKVLSDNNFDNTEKAVVDSLALDEDEETLSTEKNFYAPLISARDIEADSLNADSIVTKGITIQKAGASLSDIKFKDTTNPNAPVVKGLDEYINEKYTKPQSGIPKSHLAQNVIDSLTKADNAIPSIRGYEDMLDTYCDGIYGSYYGKLYRIVASTESTIAEEDALIENGYFVPYLVYCFRDAPHYLKVQIKLGYDGLYFRKFNVAQNRWDSWENYRNRNIYVDGVLITPNINDEILIDLSGKADVSYVNSQVSGVDTDLQGAKSDIADIKADIIAKTAEAQQTTQELTNAIGGVDTDLQSAKGRITVIENKIPNQATAQNQLADKEFVNSSITTNTAHYIHNNGLPFESEAQLRAYQGTVTNNDYAFVTGTETEHGTQFYDRYKATVTVENNVETVVWAKEWRINNTGFTAEQWASITSGITATLVAQLIADHQTLAEVVQILATKYVKPQTGIPKSDLAEDVKASLEKADESISTDDAFDSFCIEKETTESVISDATQHKVKNLVIEGNSVQESGTPTPTNPLEIESVGELITDTHNEHYGKYEIPVEVRGKNLVKVFGRTQGYPSVTTSLNTEKRTFDFNTYVVGIAAQNSYSPNNIVGFSISEDNTVKVTVNGTVAYGIGFPIRLKPNTWYFTPVAETTGRISVSLYKEDGSWLILHNKENTSIFNSGEATFGLVMLTPADPSQLGTELTFSNIFMEERIPETTTTRSAYEVYRGQLVNIYLDEPLRKVGDYVDYIDFARKKVVRQVGYVEFKQNNVSWYEPSNQVGIKRGIKAAISSDRIGVNAFALCNRTDLFTTSYPTLPQTTMWVRTQSGFNSEAIWINILDVLNIYDANKSHNEMVAEFKTWLLNNPTYVLFVRATFSEEDIDLPDVLLTRNADNYIGVDTTVQPLKVTVNYYQDINRYYPTRQLEIDSMLFGMIPHDLDVLKGDIYSSVVKCADVPNTGISSAPFPNHSGITLINLPNATEIGQAVFYKAGNVDKLIIPKVKRIGGYAFCQVHLPDTETLNLASLEDVGFEAFNGSHIKNILAPKLNALSYATFKENTKLESIVLPLATTMVSSGQAFQGCTNLETVDFPVMSTIILNTFKNCTHLTKVILRKNSVVTLGDINAFTGTPFAQNGTGGIIYVPQSLISSYESAPNWDTLVAYGNLTFRAIEGSEFE